MRRSNRLLYSTSVVLILIADFALASSPPFGGGGGMPNSGRPGSGGGGGGISYLECQMTMIGLEPKVMGKLEMKGGGTATCVVPSPLKIVSPCNASNQFKLCAVNQRGILGWCSGADVKSVGSGPPVMTFKCNTLPSPINCTFTSRAQNGQWTKVWSGGTGSITGPGGAVCADAKS